MDDCDDDDYDDYDDGNGDDYDDGDGNDDGDDFIINIDRDDNEIYDKICFSHVRPANGGLLASMRLSRREAGRLCHSG